MIKDVKEEDALNSKEANVLRLMMTDDLRNRSGNVESKDPLVCFLYVLMRDVVPIGQVAGAVKDSLIATKLGKAGAFTNGWLAKYALDLAKQLRDEGNRHE